MKEVKLGEFIVKKGGSVDPAKHVDEEFELYSIPAYDRGEPEILYGSEIGSSKKKLEPGDVIISRIVPHIRRCWVVPEKSSRRQIGSGEWITFRSKDIHDSFLRYYLLSDQFNRKFMRTVKGVGGSLLRADPKQVEKFKIPLPPLPTQRRIAAALDLADRQRQLLRTEIAAYGKLGESLFLEMFGDPVSNPKDWDTATLGSQLEFLTSGSRGWAKYYSNEGDVFLRIQNVGYDELRLEDLQRVQAPASQEAVRTTLQVGDIVLSITADLGRTGVIPADFPKAHINQHLALLRLNKSYNPKFVSSYIASKGGQSLFKGLDKGGVKAGLNFTDIKSYKVFEVALHLQNQFANRIQKIEALKAQAETALAEADDLFDTLLQRAFRGELFAEEAVPNQ